MELPFKLVDFEDAKAERTDYASGIFRQILLRSFCPEVANPGKSSLAIKLEGNYSGGGGGIERWQSLKWELKNPNWTLLKTSGSLYQKRVGHNNSNN